MTIAPPTRQPTDPGYPVECEVALEAGLRALCDEAGISRVESAGDFPRDSPTLSSVKPAIMSRNPILAKVQAKLLR